MIAEPVVPEQQTPEIPDKLYFRIGEVSRLAAVKPFVLRFWESEFPQLAPKKSGTGHRLYRRKDVEMVLEIKRLLYDERFTIEGARNFLQNRHAAAPAKAAPKAAGKRQKAVAVAPVTPTQGDLFGSGIPLAALDQFRQELQSILQLLS
ncbi:MAG: MerR family transcriptional regulator [Bryobacteraceae bacterium]|nr:MerR family transcriptional regulator [Bryobacteraceae bacterium]